MPSPAAKSHEVTVLLTQIDRRSEMVVSRLRELYPDCRFMYSSRDGLLVLRPPRALPATMRHKAAFIVEMKADGTLRTTKSKDESTTPEMVARACFGLHSHSSDETLKGAIVEACVPPEPVPLSPSCWSRLGAADDWEEDE